MAFSTACEFSSSLVKELEDEQYRCLLQWFVANGRGRRPNLPSDLQPNYRVYLQLHLLRTLYGKAWKFVEGILVRLFPLTTDYEFRSTYERCLRTTPQEENWKVFLSRTALKLDPLSEYAKHVGNGLEKLTRLDLLGNLSDLKDKLASMCVNITVTNELIVKLERFRVKENMLCQFTPDLLRCFNFEFQCSEKKAKKNIDHVVQTYGSLQKSKSGKMGKTKFEDFCNQEFSDSKPPAVNTTENDSRPTKIIPTLIPPPEETRTPQGQQIKGLEMSNSTGVQLGTKLRVVKGKCENLYKENDELKLELRVMKEENKKQQVELIENQHQLNILKSDLTKIKSDVAATHKEFNVVNSECAYLKSELSSSRQSAYYKRMKRKEDLHETYEQFFYKHSEGRCSKQISDLKITIKNLQTRIWKLKKKNEGLYATKMENKKNIAKLKAEYEQSLIQIQDESHSLKTKDGGKFTNDMIKCVIQLIGEVGIPACRCSKTIQCVSQCLFHVSLDDKDLPCNRSNMRFADRGNVLSEMHLAETILQSDGFDLHTDGTSRNNTTYVGNQATLSSGRVMSFGYSMVVTEDTETLLDVATRILIELSDIYTPDDDNSETTYKDMLRKLIGLMSDRASVMKSFNTAMNQKRSEILGLDGDGMQLQYLFCNAHFLLGLSSEAEKAIKVLQKPLDKLGRDALNIFQNFTGAGESAVTRLIRTGCDVFGPRGDEKNGCREAWEAYCCLKDQKSHIKSFRGNRFNNFFEGASALHFHRKSIIDFLSNYRASPNLKLQSVLADCKSDAVDSMLSAVGILYFVVTGPYWKLITSDTEYLDLYQYIVPMREKFLQYSTESSSLVDADLASVIPNFSVEGGDQYVKLMDVTDKTLLQTALETIFKGFLAVTDRQLSDFLPGGRYHDVQDPELRQKMKHSQLTNLTGEANLADLDFSLFTKRNATLHHRSFMNMMKRNKPMTTWLNLKAEQVQNEILFQSAKKAKPLRAKHKEAEVSVKWKAQQRIVSENKKLMEKRAKSMKRKADLSENVKAHGGPCFHPKDVDVLLDRFRTQTEKKIALNREIQYQKVVIGAKNKLLIASKVPWEVAAKNLKVYLSRLENENNGLDGDLNLGSGQEAVFHDDQCSSDSDTSIQSSVDETDSEFETECKEDVTDNATNVNATSLKRKCSSASGDTTCAKMRAPEAFLFTAQGEWVAVYYSDPVLGPTYHIGQVLDIINEKEGQVTYLEQCVLSKNQYRFGNLDVAPVKSKYVFHHGFHMTTVNGRTWTIENGKELKHMFKQYIRIYC